MKNETQKAPVAIPSEELEALCLGAAYHTDAEGNTDLTVPPTIILTPKLATLQTHSYRLTLQELIGIYEAMGMLLTKIAAKKREDELRKNEGNN